MRNLLLSSTVAICLVLSSACYAHHSFAATYFVDQSVTVKGTITEFLFRNPHSFVKIESKDDKGNVTTWSVEWGGAAQLNQDHIGRDTLRPGDIVVVEGNPGRDASDHRIRLHKMVRPSDGWKWEGVIM